MAASKFTREQRLQAVELAAVHGPTKVAETLKVPLKTLRSWLDRDFPTEYSEFRAGKQSEWRAEFAAKMEDLSERYGDVEAKALDVAEKLLDDPDVEAKDVASLIKGMGAARASASATGSRARGNPDETVQHVISFPDLERIEAMLRPGAIEGTATEVPAGELNE